MGYKEQAKAAEKQGAVRNMTPRFLELRHENDQVVGKFLSVSTIPAKDNKPPYNSYVFDTDDGLAKFSMGSNADAEFGASMTVGKVYSITFLGKDKLEGGRTVNKWSVFEIPTDIEPEPVPGK